VTTRPIRSPEGGFLPRRLRTAFAGAAFLAALAGCGASVLPQVMNDSARVPLARQLLDKGDAVLASEVLKSYAQSGAGNADIDQAVYLLGVADLRLHDWAMAQSQFERILREYPESDSASAASYRLGEALFGQSRPADFDQEYTLKALAQWQAFVQQYPDHPFVPEADAKIAECRTRLARKLWRNGDVYRKQELYEPAQFYFKAVIDEYSDTPIYGDALIGLALTDARLGRKDTALVVLRSLAKKFEGQKLGEEAGKWAERVQKWPAEGAHRRRGHKMVEPEQTPQLPTSPSTTGGISGTP